MATPLPPTGYSPIPPGPPQPYAYAPAPPMRPGGVTFASVLGIVYGALACLAGVAVAFVGAAFAGILLPFAEAGGDSGEAALASFTGLFFLVGLVIVGFGAFGIFASTQAMAGKSWARWTLVVLYGLSALGNLPSVASLQDGGVFGLAFLALDVAAIVFLVKADATAWYNAMEAPRGYYAPPMQPPTQ